MTIDAMISELLPALWFSLILIGPRHNFQEFWRESVGGPIGVFV